MQITWGFHHCRFGSGRSGVEAQNILRISQVMQMLLVLGPHYEQLVATTLGLVQVFNAFSVSPQLTPHPASYILATLLFLAFPGNSPTCTFIHIITFLHAKPLLILPDSSNITISIKASSSVTFLLG